jgi:hypothetical protein
MNPTTRGEGEMSKTAVKLVIAALAAQRIRREAADRG